jgi:signal transduction histidine kinase
MKHTIFKIITTIILILFSLSSYAEQEKPEKIIISYIEDIAPYWFRDSSGGLIGIGPDYWRLWSEKTGIEIEFKTSTWQKSIENVINGHADIHAGMAINKERSEIFTFAKIPSLTTQENLYVREGLNISKVEDIGGLPVWTDGGISESILQETYPGLHTMTFRSYEDLFKQLQKGTIDAFVADVDITAYNLIKRDMFGTFKNIYTVFDSTLHAAVTKDHAKLITIIDKGHEQISHQEREAIKNKYTTTKNEIPHWLKSYIYLGAIALVVAGMLVHYFLIRRAVSLKTKQLREKMEEEKKLRIEKEQLLISKNKLAHIGEMLNNISHQWKQPLNIINMVAEELEDISLMEEVDRKMIMNESKNIKEQVTFMSKTIDDFSSFTSPKSANYEFKLNDAVDEALKLLNYSLKHHEVNVSTKNIEELTLKGNRNEFVHVLLNLITNSVDAVAARNIQFPEISIECMKISDNIYDIVYSDNAGGLHDISPEEIFEPYISTKKGEVGTGIGLYLTKQILQKNFNASIRAENKNNGAVFYIEINK